jgi:hypothetical protein
LIVPRSVFALSPRIDLSKSRHCINGSPSQPWPKLTIASSAASKWGKATSRTSSTEGTNRILSIEAIQHSDGCNEMHPMHDALHDGDVGKGHSHLRKKTFFAAKQ